MLWVILTVLYIIGVGLFLFWRYLEGRTTFYIELKKSNTNDYLTCKISLDDYIDRQKQIEDRTSWLLRWYMKRKHIK